MEKDIRPLDAQKLRKFSSVDVAEPLLNKLSLRELVLVLATGLLSIAGGRGLAIYEAPDKLAQLEERFVQLEVKIDNFISSQEANQ